MQRYFDACSVFITVSATVMVTYIMWIMSHMTLVVS